MTITIQKSLLRYQISEAILRPSSHGKAIVPFHRCSNFWNGQIGCSHGKAIVPIHRCSNFWTGRIGCSHGKAIVPIHRCSNFWNGRIGCSDGNGTIAYPFCFVFRRESNRSDPSLFQFLEWANRLFRRERNDCLPILFCVQTGMQSFR